MRTKPGAHTQGHSTKNTPKQALALAAIPSDGMYRTVEHIHVLAGGDSAIGFETLRQSLAILAADGTLDKSTKSVNGRVFSIYRRSNGES